jgi:Family of unknown function (DUF6885)
VPGATLHARLLPGAPTLLALHARELPQRDDLCGAFCGALALNAAGVEEHAGHPLDQDAVALAAGTVLAATPQPQILPAGEGGRRDYRLRFPTVEDEARSGTTAAGLATALHELSGGRVAAIPLSGPWTTATLAAVFDTCAALDRPAALIANLATRHLWGSHATAAQLIAHLTQGADEGPPPDWDVGHFVAVFGRVDGERGALYGCADTYRSLGDDGVHMQPAGRLAAAIARPDVPAGGVIVVVDAHDAAGVRAGVAAAGLEEGFWDNGTPAAEPQR